MRLGDDMQIGRVWHKLLAVALAAALGACGAVTYDDQADTQLTALTQALNLQFLTWANQVEGTPPKPAAYDASFYDKTEAAIMTLQIRMEASQDKATQTLIPIFRSLYSQVEQLRQLHIKQKTFADGPFLRAELDELNAQLAVLLTFELSLKPSATSGSPSSTQKSTSTDTTGQAANASQNNRQTTTGK
jgi:hypothetical protein